MSARTYADAIVAIVERLRDESIDAIVEAGEVVAATLESGGRIWVATTTYTLHEEATGRAGGFIAVHVLRDTALVSEGDCVIVGSPVGTSVRPIDIVDEVHERGAYVIALTNVAFESDQRVLLDHPSRRRLHEIADLLVDVPGPFGDGVFDVPELHLRAIPHSGATGVTAMWMIFSEALSLLRARGVLPRLWECVNVEGARARNAVQLAGHRATGRGILDSGEAESVRAAR